MSRRGNSGFTDIDKRFGTNAVALEGDTNTKGSVEIRQHYLERTQGRFDPIVDVIVSGSTQIGTGTTDSENAPIRPFYDFAWSGVIYTSSELGTDVTGPKTITGLAYDVSGFVSRQGEDISDVRVFCAHYNSDTFSEANPDEDIENRSGISGWTQCTNNGYVWLPETVGVNVDERIIFDTPFEYNGIDRLMIKMEAREGSYLDQPRINWDSSTGDESVAYNWDDGTYPTGAGVRTNVRPNTVIFYEYIE